MYMYHKKYIAYGLSTMSRIRPLGALTKECSPSYLYITYEESSSFGLWR